MKLKFILLVSFFSLITNFTDNNIDTTTESAKTIKTNNEINTEENNQN
jgi:hypothetical protein